MALPCWFALDQYRAGKGCEIFDTFATHASLSYDVTDTDSWAQNGDVHSRVFATLKRRYFAKRMRTRVKRKKERNIHVYI